MRAFHCVLVALGLSGLPAFSQAQSPSSDGQYRPLPMGWGFRYGDPAICAAYFTKLSEKLSSGERNELRPLLDSVSTIARSYVSLMTRAALQTEGDSTYTVRYYNASTAMQGQPDEDLIDEYHVACVNLANEVTQLYSILRKR
jgi:hypothetical protein